MLHITDPDGYSEALSTLKQMSNSFMNAQVCQAAILTLHKDCTLCLACTQPRFACLESHLLVMIQTCFVQAANPIFMHFLSISEVYPPKLKTDEKRERLTLQNVDKYNKQIQSGHMLQPDGPFDLIDMHHLTQGRYLIWSARAEINCTWLAVGLAGIML